MMGRACGFVLPALHSTLIHCEGRSNQPPPADMRRKLYGCSPKQSTRYVCSYKPTSSTANESEAQI